MPTKRILVKQEVTTYAACLLEAGQEAGRVFEDLEELKDAYSAVVKSSQMREFLQDVNVPAENKSAFVKDAFSGLAPEVVAILSVVAERGDTKLLGRIVAEYEAQAEKALDMVVVDVTTAVPLDDHRRDVISTKLTADLGKKVRLNEKVDRSILGGIIMDTHGKRMDASVKSQLTHARQVLSNASTGGEE